jgi:hypothetical protein
MRAWTVSLIIIAGALAHWPRQYTGSSRTLPSALCSCRLAAQHLFGVRQQRVAAHALAGFGAADLHHVQRAGGALRK